MLGNISLFKGIGQKMNFLTLQQRVVSQNITHADTPNYAAREVKEPSFKQTMGRYMDSMSISGQKMAIDSTNSKHMVTKQLVGRAPSGSESREVYEVAPGENAVVLEEQVMKSSEAAMNYQLMANIYEKHIDMMKTAMRS